MLFLPPLFRRYFNARLFAIISLALFIFQLSYKHNFSPVSTAYASYLTGTAFDAEVPANLDFTNGNESGDAFRGKIYSLEKTYRDYIYGTYINGDDYAGTIKSTPFIVDTDYIYVPITGYPAKAGNSLSLMSINENGESIQSAVYAGENPGEILKFWRIESRNLKGSNVYLEISDQTTGVGGWAGAGKPLLTSRFFEVSSLERNIKNASKTYNYLFYYLSAATVFCLIFLPGVAIRRFLSIPLFDNQAFLALPGFGLLVAFGLLLWLSNFSSVFLLGRLYLTGMAILALILIFSKRYVRKTSLAYGDRLAIFFYLALCLYGLQYLSIPVEIAQEIGAGSNMRSGMVASPPDHLIPFYTAAYFFHKKKGNEMRREYFGDDWSVTSRGPLAALSINAAFNIFRITPGDPPRNIDFTFPADSEGAFLARIIGILTNAFIILSAVYLAICLGADKRFQLLFCLIWLMLSPVVLINTTFLWSKLLATYFIILALCEILKNQSFKRIGLWIALGYLSHPIGGLFAPSLILLWAHLQVSKSANSGDIRFLKFVKNSIVLSGTFILWILPWLIYKIALNHKDVFLNYIVGDGRGTLLAESFSTWLLCRWNNLLYTLVPTAFMFSDNMYSWLYGPLSEPLRWTIQYAKTLPAHLGFSLFIVAYWFSFKPNRPNSLFRLYFLLGNLLLMILFWGYSSDGLGRNCLEPLSVILIIYAASQITNFSSLLKLGLVLLLIEDFYLVFSGFFANPNFNFDILSYGNWIQFALLALTLTAFLLKTLILSKKKYLEGTVD